MVSYEPLLRMLSAKGKKRSDLTTELGISSRTVAKITKGERLSRRTLVRIAGYLSCEPDDLVWEISDNPILQALRDEKSAGISGGIYHELQVRMTYNSNHIEGSRLTQEQTRMIFETSSLNVGDGVLVDDIIETVHHFRAIDYVIDVAEEKLTEGIIKRLHYILKHDTKDSMLPWFAVGEYKRRPNMVGGSMTVSPEDVPAQMAELLDSYNTGATRTIEDIVAMHADFEKIHPFQDGNGRVGRLLALKECLRHNVVPFIIEDSKKAFYYRGLAKWPGEPGWLMDTCLDGQDVFAALLDELGVPH